MITISDSGLHDHNMLSLNIDNIGAVINIILKAPDSSCIKLMIEDFTELKMTRREPWGKGTYVASSDLRTEKDKSYIDIELNSGDTVNIEFTGSISAENI